MKKFEVSVVNSYDKEMDYCEAKVIEAETWAEAMTRTLRYLCKLQNISEDSSFATIMGSDKFARFYGCRIVCNEVNADY